MKSLLFLAAVFVAVFGAPYNDATLADWEQYKVAHNKFYETPEEDVRRLELYLANKQMVEEHNSKYERGETSFTMAVNKFSDWLPEEIRRLNGLRIDESESWSRPFELKPGTPVPKAINWVEEGAVTEVKSQGNCGSCYAFSAIGALEGLMFRTNNSIRSLSTQELVDCGAGYGCEGGLMESCFEYVRRRRGVDDDESYPYEGKEGICRAQNGVIAATCAAYVKLKDEDEMTKAVGTVGPVSIAFSVSAEFMYYHGGVFDGQCEVYPNHGMLAVGYDTDDETEMDYWLVKNSWGSTWGESGYARVIRNLNKCNIGLYSSYPT